MFLILLLGISSQIFANGAKLHLEETIFNFGWAPEKATVTHTFFFHNRGTDSLKILKVKPG